MEELEQRALYHPVTDDAQERLVAYSHKGDNVGMPQVPPMSYLVAKRLRFT
jgi:hypothetical protein